MTFVHFRYFEYVQDIRFENILGPKDFWSNYKGFCQAIRFQIMDSTFCFLNTVLLESKTIKAKNQELLEVQESLEFGEEYQLNEHK